VLRFPEHRKLGKVVSKRKRAMKKGRYSDELVRGFFGKPPVSACRSGQASWNDQAKHLASRLPSHCYKEGKFRMEDDFVVDARANRHSITCLLIVLDVHEVYSPNNVDISWRAYSSSSILSGTHAVSITSTPGR